MFNIQTGNYAQAGNAAANDAIKSFAAARRNSPDYGKMVQQAAALRSKQKVEGINAAAQVTRAGIQTAGSVKKTEVIETARRGRDKAKRKAGALAAAGKMFATAGQFGGEKRTKREISDTSPLDSRIESLRSKASELRTQAEGVTIPQASSSTPSSNTGGGASTNSGSSSTPISSYQASGKTGKYSVSDMTNFALGAGFSPEQAKVMGAIGMAESGGNATIDTVQSGLDPNRSNEFSVGLFQVNAQAHGDKLSKLGYTSDDLRDPAKAAQVAKMVYDEVGSFKPWSVYKSGAYSQYLQ